MKLTPWELQMVFQTSHELLIAVERLTKHKPNREGFKTKHNLRETLRCRHIIFLQIQMKQINILLHEIYLDLDSVA